MLRVIRRIRETSPITVRATFLGAHAVGRAYKGRQQEYVDLICREMIPAVGREKLAEFVDVFCDQGFFTVEETEQILRAGAEYGLVPKIHANELAVSGGVQVVSATRRCPSIIWSAWGPRRLKCCVRPVRCRRCCRVPLSSWRCRILLHGQ